MRTASPADSPSKRACGGQCSFTCGAVLLRPCSVPFSVVEAHVATHAVGTVVSLVSRIREHLQSLRLRAATYWNTVTLVQRHPPTQNAADGILSCFLTTLMSNAGAEEQCSIAEHRSKQSSSTSYCPDEETEARRSCHSRWQAQPTLECRSCDSRVLDPLTRCLYSDCGKYCL